MCVSFQPECQPDLILLGKWGEICRTLRSHRRLLWWGQSVSLVENGCLCTLLQPYLLPLLGHQLCVVIIPLEWPSCPPLGLWIHRNMENAILQQFHEGTVGEKRIVMCTTAAGVQSHVDSGVLKSHGSCLSLKVKPRMKKDERKHTSSFHMNIHEENEKTSTLFPELMPACHSSLALKGEAWLQF